MVTHSSILAWKTPWTEEPGRLHSPWSCKSWTQLVVKIQESNDKLAISKSFLISFFLNVQALFRSHYSQGMKTNAKTSLALCC